MSEKVLIWVILHQELSGFHSTFTLIGELGKKGYRVIYLGDPTLQEYVVAQGFEYRVFEADGRFARRHQAIMERKLQIAKKSKSKRHEIKVRAEMAARWYEHLLEKADRWLEKDTPDLVLIEQACIYKAIPFLKNNIPIIGINNTLSTSFDLKKPPLFSAYIPNRRLNAFGYTRNLIEWLRIYIRHSLYNINGFLNAGYAGGIFSSLKTPSEKKMIKKYGGKTLWWEYGAGFKVKVPELVMCPYEFDLPFVPETDDRCYAGACIDTKRISLPFDWSKIDQKKPIIYCSVGSHPDYCKYRMRLFASLIEAVKQRPNLQLIVQIAEQSERESFNPLPDNVFTVEWVPQLEVLSKTHIFITHGGLSSVREGLYHGVPMIVFPWGVDQPGNGTRVAFHHLGLRGNMKKVTAKIVGQQIDKICNDPSYHHSTKQIKKIFREQETCQKGVNYIDTMISKSRKVSACNQNMPPELTERVVVEI